MTKKEQEQTIDNIKKELLEKNYEKTKKYC